MNRKEWDDAWLKLYNIARNTLSKNHLEALSYANTIMHEKFGNRPNLEEKPHSQTWFAFRLFWLLKVKKMDFRKLLIGGLSAFVVGFVAVLPALIDQGLTQAELMSAVAAGLAALGLYLKDPNAHKGPDLR